MTQILIATSDKKAGGIERALFDQLALLQENAAYHISLLSPASAVSNTQDSFHKLGRLRRFAFRTLPGLSTIGLTSTISAPYYDIALCHNGFMAKGLKRIARHVIGICHNDKPHHFTACDRLVCLTEKGMAKAAKAGWDKSRLHLIPHFHETVKGRDIPKPHAPIVIGAAGRMVGKKNLSLFIEIAALVKQTHGNIRFILGGDGPLKDQLTALNQAKGTAVEMPGWVDFPRFLQELDMMVIPSLDEPFGFIFPEAMAEGVAVMATPTHGASHCLSNGTIGTIFPADKPEAFAAEICAMADNLSALHQRQKDAYAHVCTPLFDRAQARRKWEALLASCQN